MALTDTTVVLGCGGAGSDPPVGNPRLSTLPHQPANTLAPGDYTLGLDTPRDARLHVPPGYDPAHPAPLVLGFHGAGAQGYDWNHTVQPATDAIGAVLLAPDSRGATWDGITGTIGVDVAFIDRALAWLYDRVNIDTTRMAIGGFADGATYALGLGLANGDMFHAIIAMSPGFLMSIAHNGLPRIFIAHGTSDTVLPIATTSRRIVPQLQNAGYNVTYHEFDGGNVIDAAQRDAAFAWMAAG